NDALSQIQIDVGIREGEYEIPRAETRAGSTRRPHERRRGAAEETVEPRPRRRDKSARDERAAVGGKRRRHQDDNYAPLRCDLSRAARQRTQHRRVLADCGQIADDSPGAPTEDAARARHHSPQDDIADRFSGTPCQTNMILALAAYLKPPRPFLGVTAHAGRRSPAVCFEAVKVSVKPAESPTPSEQLVLDLNPGRPPHQRA